MIAFLKGIACLVAVILFFSLVSLKFPSGDKAMSGVANAAVCTFLVEAIYKYILGDFAGIEFFGAVGSVSGSMGAPAAALLVGIAMGSNPIYAAAGAFAVAGYGILPGFLAGYAMYWLIHFLEKHLPSGIDMILLTLISAAGHFAIARYSDPYVTSVLNIIGGAISEATTYSPVVMGFILGGLMKIICTSPMSSMALTAMLGLTGLPMGIAAVACFGGTFSNGLVFKRLKMGDNGKVIAVMLEPLTQANIITSNPVIIYSSSFLGGALSGTVAALFGIVDNAPGTASPIPGLLAPFAFNPPGKVAIVMAIALVCGVVSGFVISTIAKKINYKVVIPN